MVLPGNPFLEGSFLPPSILETLSSHHSMEQNKYKTTATTLTRRFSGNQPLKFRC